MKKFILTGACLLDNEELDLETPKVFTNLLAARREMMGNIMMDLEEDEFYSVPQHDGTKKLYTNCDCAVEIGQVGRMFSYILMGDFYSSYEITEVDV